MAEKSGISLTPEEVFAKAKTGGLVGANLANIKLPKADLRGAKLRNIAAGGANLRKADLSGADLSGADLSDADLREANFTGADLTGAKLDQAKAKEANFTGAKLAGVKALQADFGKAVFQDADLTDADVSKALFHRARLSGAKLIRAKCVGTKAADADLLDIDLTGADLRGGVFQECRLARVQAAGLNAQGVDFSLAELKDVDFSRAGLVNAQFFSGVLENVNFTGADLSGAVFNGSDQENINFQDAVLKKASLKSISGVSEELLRGYKSQGALVDMFLIRRFLRLLRSSHVAQAVVLVAIAAISFFTYRFFAGPQHWSYDVLQKQAEKTVKLGEYDAGIKLYQVIVQKYAADPNRVAAAKLAIAGVYAQRRQYEKALAQFEAIATTYEGNPEAVFAIEAMAKLYAEMGEPDKARALYEKIRKTEVDNPDAEASADFGLAELLKKEGRNEEALAKYLAVFDKFQSELSIGNRALAEAIAVQCALERIDDAEKTLARLKDYDAGATSLWMRVDAEMAIANALRKRGDLDKAEQRYKSVYTGTKDLTISGPAGIKLVELYQGQGRFRETEDLIADMTRRATTEEMRDELVMRQARLLEAMGKPDKALAMLAGALPGFKDRNKYYEGSMSLLSLYAAAGNLPPAEAIYNDVLKKYAADPERVAGAKTAMGRMYAGKGFGDKALALYREVIAHSPNPDQVATAKLDLASALRRAGSRDKAEQIYRELYEGKGAGWQTLAAGLTLVESYSEQKKFADAEKQLDDMEARWREPDVDRADVLLRRARLLQEEGKNQEAIARLQELAPQLKDPNKKYDADFQFLHLYRITDNLPAAEECYRRIQEHFGQDAEKMSRTKVEMAQFYSTKGLNDKAETLYREILAQSHNADAESQAKLNLADQYRQTGNQGKAEKLYRELLEGSIDGWQPFQAGMSLTDILIDRQAYDEAQQILAGMRKKWESKPDERAEIVFHQAALLERVGKPAEGVALMKKELPTLTDPAKAVDAQFLLIELYAAAGDMKAAEETVKATLKSAGAAPARLAQAKVVLGKAYDRLGQNDKAGATFREVIAQYPDSEAALQAKADLGGMLRRAGDLPKAEKIFRELSESTKDSWQVFAAAATVADILATEGKTAEADKQLDAMIKRWGNRREERSDIVIQRSRLYQKENRVDDAIALLRAEMPKFLDTKRLTDANALLMELYAGKGEPKAAEEAFGQLAKTIGADDERLVAAKMSLAQMHVDQGQGDRAAAVYRELIAHYPNAPVVLEAKLNLANEMRREGDRAAAEKMFREVMAAKKDTWETLAAGLSLADLLGDQQKFAEAEALLAELAKEHAAKDDERADIVLRQIALLQRQKKTDLAAALLARELPKFADRGRRFEGYRMLLDLDREQGNLPALEELYATAVKEFAADAERTAAFKLIVGRAYVAKGLPDKALPLLKDAASLNGHTDVGMSARLELANTYRRTEEKAKAEELYRGLLDEPRGPWQAFNAGVFWSDMLDEQSRFADEEKLYAKMLTIWSRPGSDRADIIIRQARLMCKTKRGDAAVALLEREIGSFNDPNKVYDGDILLIETYRQLGKTDKATTIYQQVKAAYPNDGQRLARAEEALQPQ